MRFATAEEVAKRLDWNAEYVREVMGGYVHYCACTQCPDGADECRSHRHLLELYFKWMN